MSEYRIAKVRFSNDGKPYPVNSKFDVKPDDYVIVRLDGKFTPLQKAQVIDVEYWRGECKHSIVCMADDFSKYGNGPDDVSDEQTLDRFLTDFLNKKRFKVVYEKSYKVIEDHPKWHAAYIYNRVNGWKENERATVSTLLLIGKEEIVYRDPDDGEWIEIKDGAILMREDAFSRNLYPDRGNIYKQAAERAEGPLAPDLNPAPDNTRGQIRAAIGGDGYLSDGEYV